MLKKPEGIRLAICPFSPFTFRLRDKFVKESPPAAAVSGFDTIIRHCVKLKKNRRMVSSAWNLLFI